MVTVSRPQPVAALVIQVSGNSGDTFVITVADENVLPWLRREARRYGTLEQCETTLDQYTLRVSPAYRPAAVKRWLEQGELS